MQRRTLHATEDDARQDSVRMRPKMGEDRSVGRGAIGRGGAVCAPPKISNKRGRDVNLACLPSTMC